MYESPYDNYTAFEEFEREQNRIERRNLRLYHDYGESGKGLNGPGYLEIGTDIFVREEDAYNYAVERLSLDEDLQKEFVEWFYSEDWIEEE